MLAKKPKGATTKRERSSVAGLLWMFVGAVLTLMIGVFLYLSPLFDFNKSPDNANDTDRQVQPRVNTDTDNEDYEFYDILPNQEMVAIPDEEFGDGSQAQVGDNGFEPDVVVTEPPVDSGNFGVSETTTIEPSGTNAAGSGDDGQITVVEEDATYDAPSAPSNNGNGNANSNNGNGNGNAGRASVQSAGGTTYILQINSFSNADEADRRRAQVLMAGVDAKVIKNTTANGEPIYQVISRTMNSRQAVSRAQQSLQNNGIDSIIVEQRR
ncbi:SPOR domain-containing protein [Psychrobacter aestuarii]|uniref:SPOR domain-containing protein n=1 Tax=Psychrobacter aestuarii TaxID=556327 RepID=A0ABN0VSF3_9GAMM|nr:SPOR domain-containing protein [Psychrobacter aestuarii]